MWQMKPGSGLEPASPRETDYRYGAPTTRLWPGPRTKNFEEDPTPIDRGVPPSEDLPSGSEAPWALRFARLLLKDHERSKQTWHPFLIALF